MHPIQKAILQRLIGQSKQRYAALTRGYTYEDNIVFHLKQLVSGGLIKKIDGKYLITAEGVKAIAGFDLGSLDDTGFKTFFIGLLCRYENKYLVKEHPQGAINFYNLPSGKPQFGEPIGAGLSRTFQENIGLTLDPERFSFHSLHLKTVKTSRGEVLFDDAFTVYEVKVAEQDVASMQLKEAITWMSKEEIAHLDKRWPELDICILCNDRTVYQVYEVVSDYILDDTINP